MPNPRSQWDERQPEDEAPLGRTKDQEELDRIAEELAERASRTERRYDSEHGIFSK